MGKIFLIAADWQFRALVCAQLLGEGFEVRPWSSFQAALQDLIISGQRARLTILDIKDLDFEAGATGDFLRLMEDTPLILCGDALSQSSLSTLLTSRAKVDQEGPPPDRVLLRPFRVGDLVEEVRRVWACLEGEAKADASLDATG